MEYRGAHSYDEIFAINTFSSTRMNVFVSLIKAEQEDNEQ